MKLNKIVVNHHPIMMNIGLLSSNNFGNSASCYDGDYTWFVKYIYEL